MFSVGDDKRQSNGVVTLRVGGVHLLIDSGATSNLLGKPTWEWLKTQRIQCKIRKDAKVLFAYGNTKPLPTLEIFTAHVMCTDTNATVEAEFVVIDGDGRNLLCRDTAEKLSLLRIGPIHSVNSVEVEITDQDIRDKYKELFTGVGLFEGLRVQS